MLLKKLLDSLFQSKTIAPNYKIPHIIYTIFILGQNTKGIGRYRIKTEITLGEGSTKTLLNRLKEEGVIKIEGKKQTGHILTSLGIEYYEELKKLMLAPQFLENENNKYVIGNSAAYTIVKKQNLIPTVNIGINQRDEAIKIGGSGASCLIFKNNQLVFPKNQTFSPENLLEKIEKKKQLESGDYVIIGAGDSPSYANLATIAAALSLISF